MARLVIFGAGDIARLAHHYFTTDSPHRIVAFTVDRDYMADEAFPRAASLRCRRGRRGGTRRVISRCSSRCHTPG